MHLGSYCLNYCRADVRLIGVLTWTSWDWRTGFNNELKNEDWIKWFVLKFSGQISPKCLKEFVQIAEYCLRSSRNLPMMTGVVVALSLSMALQQHNSSLQLSLQMMVLEKKKWLHYQTWILLQKLVSTSTNCFSSCNNIA